MLLTEADAPSYQVTETQKSLNVELRALGMRVAVVVPNSRLAMIGRQVFSEHTHKVVYEDLAEAALWLAGPS